MFCCACGQQLSDGARFCSFCGESTQNDNGQVQGRGQRKLVPCLDDEHNQPSPQHLQGPHLYFNPNFLQGDGHYQQYLQHQQGTQFVQMEYSLQGHGHDQPTSQNPPSSWSYKVAYYSQGAGHNPPPAHHPLEFQETIPVMQTTHSLKNHEIYTGSQTGQQKPEEPSRLMENTNNLSILLVGRTGHGKSATGNSLLGITKKEGFHEEKSPVSVTENYQRLVKKRFGRMLEVVDTPGIFDTSKAYQDQFVYEQIAKCIGMTLPGFNAIILVLHSDRFTLELVKTVEIFFKFFGRGVDQYSFVLFTNMETEEDMKNYLKGAEKRPEDEGAKAFQLLRKRCQDKLLFIDNKASEDIKEEMVWNILTAVDTANAKSLRPYFSNKLTREMEQRAKDYFHTQVSALQYAPSKEDLRILLVGLSGHGKSATGNSIMGKSIFTKNASMMENAYQQTESGKINGREIQIVEFAVKDPSSQSEADLKKQMLQTEKMLQPGFHALCFVIDPNKISDVKDHFIQVMEYFGDDVNDYAFVIMTFSKNEDEYEKHFHSKIQAKHPVASVLKFCKGKELYMDNKALPEEKKEMIEDMFTFIDSENAKMLTPYFSSRFKQLTEMSEAAISAEATKAAETIKKIKHKERKKRDFEKTITEQKIKDSEANQKIQQLEFEIRLKDLEKKTLEEKAAEAEHREEDRKEREEKKKEKRQREQVKLEEKNERERKEKEEKKKEKRQREQVKLEEKNERERKEKEEKKKEKRQREQVKQDAKNEREILKRELKQQDMLNKRQQEERERENYKQKLENEKKCKIQ